MQNNSTPNFKVSQKGIDLIKKYEGLKTKAYICPAGKVTIGYGTTLYPNAEPVKMGDSCTPEQADKYLKTDLERRAAAIGNIPFNQNQIDAVLSFVYNVGMSNWNNSTLRKLAKNDPNDKNIRTEFYKWNKVRKNGSLVVENGLTKRRKEEADLYFS